MSKPIDISIHPSEWEPMKYWSLGASLSKEQKAEKIDYAITNSSLIGSEKFDGDLCRVIWDEDTVLAQSRSISKKTGTYGDLTDKLLFMENILNAFSDRTVLLGEVYLPGGTAKEVGSVLRCLPAKALERQKDNPVYYYIFDVLMYEGKDLTQTPMEERIKYLKPAAEKINSPLVNYAHYFEVKPETFYGYLQDIFSKGGEGVVLYKRSMLPCQGRTSAWETIKVKRELEIEADCFIAGTLPPQEEYTGKELPTWQYWEDMRTKEKVEGSFYSDYYRGAPYRPITKSFFHGWVGSIRCGVFNDKHEIIELCRCSNLTEELMEELKNNFDNYYMKVIKVDGMSLSYREGSIYPSIRHPKIVDFRDDMDAEDCTMNKILGE